MENPEDDAEQKVAPTDMHRPSPPRSVAMLVKHARFMRRRRSVEKVQASTSLSQISRSARSRMLTKFLRMSETVGTLTGNFTFFPQGRIALQLHCEYDASCYSLQRRDRSTAGPLALAFVFYAKVLDPRVATGKYYPLFDSIDRAAKTMTFTELLAFCWDFDIVPQLISRGDLRYIFRTVSRDPDDKLTELTFGQFEELLTRISLVAFYPLSDQDVRRIGSETMRKLREHIDAKRIRIKDVFRRFDTSGDGILSRDEFMQGLRDICGDAIKQRDLEAVYSLVDEDGGGEVEYIEFVAALNKAAPPQFAKEDATTNDERYTVPYNNKMEEWEDKDSDKEDDASTANSRSIFDETELEDEYDEYGNKIDKIRETKTLPNVASKRPYRKCLADYASAGIEKAGGAGEKGGQETKTFPGGRSLSPKERVQSLMLSLGKLTNAAFKRIIQTRGKVTAGKINGSIKSNGDFDFVASIKVSQNAGAGAGPSDSPEEIKGKQSRMLRKRDGTMCDFSAPLLMERRRASTADYSPELKSMWKRLREVNRIDDWRSYHAPCIYMGRLLVGDKHMYRINVRNPLPFSITLDASLREFPHSEAFFSRQPVASGLSTTIVVKTCMKHEGEFTGALLISWRCYQNEILARKARFHDMVPDKHEGTCSVPLYAIATDKSSYAAKEIMTDNLNLVSSANDRGGLRLVSSVSAGKKDFRCPAKEFEKICEFSRCPRYSLPVEHIVHKFEVPSSSGDWHRRQPYLTNDGRSGTMIPWRQAPTRLRPSNTLPRMGSGRMMGKDLPTQIMNTMSNVSLSSTVSLDEPDKARRRGFLPHAYTERKRRQQEKKSKSKLETFEEEVA